jgi:hypothetical protein
MSMAVNYGTANASPIVALESAGNYDKRVQVTLTATYVRSLPGGAAAGYIDPNPSQVGNRVTTTGVPSTFSSGTVLTLFPAEAAALVAASAAHY